MLAEPPSCAVITMVPALQRSARTPRGGRPRSWPGPGWSRSRRRGPGSSSASFRRAPLVASPRLGALRRVVLRRGRTCARRVSLRCTRHPNVHANRHLSSLSYLSVMMSECCLSSLVLEPPTTQRRLTMLIREKFWPTWTDGAASPGFELVGSCSRSSYQGGGVSGIAAERRRAANA